MRIEVTHIDRTITEVYSQERLGFRQIVILLHEKFGIDWVDFNVIQY